LINPIEYTNRSYDELSAEFKRSLSRAIELVPLMYNRLTLIDEMSHKAAISKMYNDHRHLPGFSDRNIRRYLPLSNKAVPRRVRPPRPKNSLNETLVSERLSNTKQRDSVLDDQNKDPLHFEFFVSRDDWWEHFIKPISSQAEDFVHVKVALDKRTKKGTIRIE
jgi:hypothetical protein